jgi:MOSC domain-containing protein YiiM
MIPQARIFQINASNGGVPKLPMRAAEINFLGITVDRHNDAVHHGGPTAALCLYSLENILALQAEGHPIYPGSIGENVTISGLDWTKIVPGVRLRLGDSVQIEITEYATPCKKIRESFLHEEFNRVHNRKHPGWARAYARVLTPGLISLGNIVTVKDEG